MKTENMMISPREIRRSLGMNQQQFWTRLGVTQSGGSRYESGRNMPKPVLELLRLVYVERVDLARINREDIEVIEYMKAHQPELYLSMRKTVRGRRKSGNGQQH